MRPVQIRVMIIIGAMSNIRVRAEQSNTFLKIAERCKFFFRKKKKKKKMEGPVCKYNQSGYCKHGTLCHKRHENKVCPQKTK